MDLKKNGDFQNKNTKKFENGIAKSIFKGIFLRNAEIKKKNYSQFLKIVAAFLQQLTKTNF